MPLEKAILPLLVSTVPSTISVPRPTIWPVLTPLISAWVNSAVPPWMLIVPRLVPLTPANFNRFPSSARISPPKLLLTELAMMPSPRIRPVLVMVPEFNVASLPLLIRFSPLLVKAETTDSVPPSMTNRPALDVNTLEIVPCPLMVPVVLLSAAVPETNSAVQVDYAGVGQVSTCEFQLQACRNVDRARVAVDVGIAQREVPRR